MDTLQVFNKWEKISIDLYAAVRKYVDCFYKLDEMYFREKALDEEVNKTEEQSVQNRAIELKITIQELYEDFVQCTKLVASIIEKENNYNEENVKTINKYITNIMRRYSHIFEELDALKEDFKQPSSCIDASKMNVQRRKLDKAIRDFNKKFPTTEDCKLLSTVECEKLNRQRLIETMDWLIAHPDWK